MNLTPPTIADIAKLAGVGTATVDRVLNARSGVNIDTEQKIKKAMESLGQPQVLRGRPRGNRAFRLAYVLPDTESPFFELLERQIAQVASDFRHKHTTEVTYRFNAENPADFAQKLSEVEDCDGIALLAPDLPAIKLAINDKIRAGIRVVTLFSDVAGSMRDAHIGADNRAIGRTAGLLLGRMCDPQKQLLLLTEPTRFSAEIERHIGFTQVIEERFAHLNPLQILELPQNEALTKEALQHFLTANKADEIGGIYSLVKEPFCIVNTLDIFNKKAPKALPAILLHNLTEHHQSLLLSHQIAYILHQDIHYCVLTAARVLRDLCDKVRGALNVAAPRIEILTAENLH